MENCFNSHLTPQAMSTIEKQVTMKTLDNFHILQISLVPMTESFPPRIRIKSQRFQQSIIIPFQNEPGESDHISHSAQIWLEKQGFELIGKGEGNDVYDYIVTDTFKPLKPFKD